MGTDSVPIGATAIKPVERHGWEAVSWFLYDRNTGAIMGRTPMSWLLITVFYIIYYTLLAGFWMLCLTIFFQFVDDHQPRWQQDGSLIGSSPALGVRPGQDADMIESSMIIFNKDATKDEIAVPGRQGWIDRNNKFLEPYKTPKGKGVDCAGGEANTGEGEYCKFDLASLGECAEANYGFDTNSPCLILKLNKIYGLVPDYYNSSVDDMPDDLKTRIDAAQEKNQIWVSCKGENPADNEGVESFEYFPAHAGFSSSFFPYLNQEGYQSPLVAVKLHNVNVGQLLHIECRAWAGNINYNRRDRVGIVHFELLVHDDDSADIVNQVASA